MFLWKCDFEKSVFKVSYSYSFGYDKLQKNVEFFVVKCLKISQELHGGDKNMLRYVKTQKSQNRQVCNFSTLCQLQLSISQNRPVRLVPCFVGVHHI